MGTTLTPIAVDLAKLRAACGSGDETLLASVIKAFRRDFEQFDEMGEDLEDADEDEASAGNGITMKEALGHLIRGEELNPKAGFMYGYALRFLAQKLGKRLPNDHWCSLKAWSFFPEVDEALAAMGVPESYLRVEGPLTGRGSPVPIPPIEDFPAIGHLTRDEARRAADALTDEKIREIEPEWVREGLEEILAWLRKCVTSNCDLVCFHA